MSKVTKFMASIVGALFYTLAILIFTAEGNFRKGEQEMKPPIKDENGQN